MDDLTAKVQEILGSEEGMRQLQEMAKMLGLSGDGANSPPESAPAPGSSGLEAVLSGLTGSSRPAEEGVPFSPADLARLGSLMQSVKEDTPATALLKALRPLLREERQKKVDQAVRMMRLFSLLPLLQQSGILNSLTGGENS